VDCQKDVIFVDVAADVALDGSSSSRRPLGLAGMFISRSLLGGLGDLSSGSDILGLVLGTSRASALLGGLGDLSSGSDILRLVLGTSGTAALLGSVRDDILRLVLGTSRATALLGGLGNLLVGSVDERGDFVYQ